MSEEDNSEVMSTFLNTAAMFDMLRRRQRVALTCLLVIFLCVFKHRQTGRLRLTQVSERIPVQSPDYYSFIKILDRTVGSYAVRTLDLEKQDFTCRC